MWKRKFLRNSVVYQVSCKGCTSVRWRETWRPDRLTKHRQAVRWSNDRNVIAVLTCAEVWPPHWLGRCLGGMGEPCLLKELGGLHKSSLAKSIDHKLGLWASPPTSMEAPHLQIVVSTSSIMLTISCLPPFLSIFHQFLPTHFLSWCHQSVCLVFLYFHSSSSVPSADEGQFKVEMYPSLLCDLLI